MFTGIIDHTGCITQITELANGLEFTVHTQFTDLALGESIAIDGVCLTVASLDNTTFRAQLSPSTLAVTHAANYRCQQLVNLERSLAANARFGGHFVTGHVDRVTTIQEITQQNDFYTIKIGPFSEDEARLMVEKGSIAVDGVSLTINNLSKNLSENSTKIDFYCHLMVIPHTWSVTTWHRAKIGDLVNIEFDMMAKLISNFLKNTKIN
jgi:riboflavin synthase